MEALSKLRCEPTVSSAKKPKLPTHEKTEIFQPKMEDLIMRFPHLAEKIFDSLENKSLTKLSQKPLNCRQRHPHQIIWHPPNRTSTGATRYTWRFIIADVMQSQPPQIASIQSPKPMTSTDDDVPEDAPCLIISQRQRNVTH